jgi:carbon storage regulator
MLVITRKVGESITIGEDVVVSVLASRGKQIRLGIAAPKSMTVLTEELKRPGTEKTHQRTTNPSPERLSYF